MKNEKLIKKIKKLLAKNDVGEDKISNIIDELEKEDETEEVVEVDEEVGATEKPNEDASDTPAEEGAMADVVESETKGDSEVKEDTPEVDEAQPNDMTPDSIVQEAMQENPNENPSTPMVDNTNEELKSKVDELTKANEGLMARLDSLEEALKKSGIMSESDSPKNPVGVDKSSTPANNPEDDPMDSVLAEINGRRY